MDNNKIKEDILQQLIDLMESKETESLKSKSPKFMSMEVEATKLPEEKEEEKFSEPSMPVEESKEEDPEDLKRLLEMYAKLK